MLSAAMNHDGDDQDTGENDLVIALTPAQLGVVAALTVAVIIWFVVRRDRSTRSLPPPD